MKPARNKEFLFQQSFIKNINMQNSNGFSKNILILTLVLFALVASLSVMLKLSQNRALVSNTNIKGIAALVDNNISELNTLDANLAMFAEDNLIMQELDATLSEVGEIDDVAESLISEEEALNDLNADITDLSGDEDVSNEIDRYLEEVSL